MFCKKCHVEGHSLFSEECVFFKETIDYISSRLNHVPKKELTLYIPKEITYVPKKKQKVVSYDIKDLSYDMKDLSEEEIIQLVKDKLKVCSCGYTHIYPVCDNCTHFTPTESQLWKEIQEYCIDHGLISCNFCGKIKEKDYRFHFDHLSIFDKSDSVCSMVKHKYKLSDIITEIQKCQLLCIHCHYIVTNIENHYGFICMKKVHSHTDKLKACYKEKMEKVYEILKRIMPSILNIKKIE
jgi:hypothetical protein